MSKEEQDAAIGKAYRELGETNRLIAALLARADEWGSTFWDLGGYLRHDHQNRTGKGKLRTGEPVPDVVIPTRQQLVELETDYREAIARKAALEEILNIKG